jgi:hypothetical protein
MAAPKAGGFKMSLGGLKDKVGLKASLSQKDAKRPRLALGDDEEDDSNKQQEISGWDAAEGGAVDIGGIKEKEGPRIIPTLPNRDWRGDARRKQLAKAPHTQVKDEVVEEQLEKPKIQYGLTILKKEEQQENGTKDVVAPAEPMEDVKDSLTEEQRLDKKALDALIHGKSTDDDLVIPLQSEEEAFRNDIRDAPEAPSLDAYEATPIEGYGAALLRGMGWKDNDANGNAASAKPKEFKRRAALLGIGAKEEAAMGVELGDFKGGKGKGKKVAQSYNPVTLRNKVTGEMITEEELKAKLEHQDMVPDEKPKKERRKYSDDDEDDRRREKRRDGRDRDRRRDDEYDSERRRDKDRRREKDDSDRRRDKCSDKYKDDEYDSERRKEKRGDRHRDDEYDSERRREKRRDRSRSPVDKKRDRYRSRSRDSKRDRDRRERSRDGDDDRRMRRREYVDERDEKKKKRTSKDEKYR